MSRLNHISIYNGDVEFCPSDFPSESNSKYVPYPNTTPIKPIYDGDIYHLLELFQSEHDDDVLDVDLQIIQALLVVAPPLKIYTTYTVLFYKDEESNVAVTNYMSRVSIFL